MGLRARQTTTAISVEWRIGGPILGSMATWRLLALEARDGATNLAIDEAVGESVARGDAPPTLRFYTWSRPCLALGAFQSIEDVSLDARRGQGPLLVRRLSGGTLVLHDDGHLGYSLALPPGHPLAAPDILQAYRLLNERVAEGLRALAVQARLVSVEEARADRPDPLLRPACYGGLSPFEIVARGRKLVGSAQLRRRGLVLHEGGVLLRFDAAATARWLAADTVEANERRATLLGERVTDLGRELRRGVAASEVAETLLGALGPTVGPGHPSPGALTARECADAERLLRARYASPAWTRRR
jgi:lipoate-protein ligase A